MLGIRVILVTWLCASTAAEDEARLQPGRLLQGIIEAGDSTVESPGLARYADAAIRAKTFEIRTPDTGVYRIEMSSHYFDPYLVLRDEQGNVLVEDDDGWLATYPRLVIGGLPPDRMFRVDACALHGETGPFEIRMLAGPPEPVTPQSHSTASLDRTKESLAIVRKELGEKHPSVVLRLDDVAYFLTLLGHYDEARSTYDRALALSQEIHGEDGSVTGRIVSNTGELYQVLGDYDTAADRYERAATIFEKTYGADHIETAHALANLGAVAFDQGDYERARPLMERVLAIRRDRFGRRSAATAESLHTLAVMLDTIGSYEEARPLYEESLDITQRLYGKDDPRVAQAQNSLALLLKKQGKRERARELYDQAFALANATLGRTHPLTLSILSNRAVLMQERGKTDEAERLLGEVLAIRETLGTEHPLVSTTLNNLALSHLARGDHEAARAKLSRAVAMDKKILGSDHPSTVLRLSNLAVATARAGDVAGAVALEVESLAARRAILERQLPVLSESERFRWVARQHRSLEQLLTLATGVEDGTDVAYREVAYWKGLVSRGLLQDRAWLSNQTDPELLELQRDLEQVLARMSRIFFDEDRDPLEQTELLNDLRARRGELERAIATRTERDRQRVVVDLDAIRKALGKRGALLDFVLYKDADGVDSLAVFVVRNNAPITRVDLGPMTPRRNWIQDHVAAIQSKRGITRVGPSGPDRRNFWSELAPRLEGVDRVFVCPEADVATLPFDTLPGESPDTYLIETYAFIYLQSALDLLATEPEALGKGLLLVGGVDYDADPTTDATVTDEASREATASDPGDTRGFGRPFMPLEFTDREARELSYLYGRDKGHDKRDVDLLRAGDATERRVKRAVAGKQYVHLATHGFFDKTPLRSMLNIAMRSADGSRGASFESRHDVIEGLLPGLLTGLILAGANIPDRPTDDDGILTAEELAWLDLRGCRLATLSACESGLGEAQAGEHLIGLRRALRLAGARTTVTSLWEVGDASTKELMKGFYTRLWYEGQGVHDALRGAQLELLERNRANHGGGRPGTWGAFVLEGAWR